MKTVAGFFSDSTLVMAAVSVVLPWSMCPIVPTLTCGLVRSNFCLAMSEYFSLISVTPPRARRLSVPSSFLAYCGRVRGY